MNITITQDNSRIETLGSNGASIILKLYDLAIDSNNTLTLRGNISTAYAYGNLVDYLNNTYGPDLIINATNRYITFADPEFGRIAILTYSTDGIGVIQSQLDAVTKSGDFLDGLSGNLDSNVVITTLIDLLRFKNMTSFDDWSFRFIQNLTEMAIPKSVKSIGSNVCYLCRNVSKIIIEDIDSYCNLLRLGTNLFALSNNVDLYTISNGSLIKVTDLYINGNIAQLWMFNNCKSIQSVTFSNNVGAIPDSTFGECTNLTTVNGTLNITTIRRAAFSGCTALSTIDLSNCTTIESDAFKDCTSLSSVGTINFTSFSLACFRNCTSLTLPISVLENATSIEGYAFDGVKFTGNNGVVVFSNSLTRLGDDAYYGARILAGQNGITKLDLSNTSLTFVASQLIRDNTTLTEVVLPTTITKINGGAFQNDTNLNTINLSLLTSLTYIGDYTFYGTSIPSQDLSSTALTEIQNNAFQNCNNMTEIKLPSTITTIGWNACSRCTKVTILATTPPTLGNNTVFASGATIYVPDGALSTYQNAGSTWSNYTFLALSNYV